MKCHHHSVEFELPDKWIEEAGVRNFRPSQKCYPPDMTKTRGEDILEIEISSIEPLTRRAETKGVFCNSEETGESAKERVMRILINLKTNQKMEPVKVAPSDNENYEYKLTQGSHRFHCAIAMGYKYVPATIDRVHVALSA